MKNTPCLLGGLLPNDGALILSPLLIPSPLPAMLLSSAQVTKIVGQNLNARKRSSPMPTGHTHSNPMFSEASGAKARVNNLVYKCIFCLHYATAKVLIYNLQHINHPLTSNATCVINIHVFFNYLAVLGEGSKSVFTKSISSGYSGITKGNSGPPMVERGNSCSLPSSRCLAHMQAGHKSN